MKKIKKRKSAKPKLPKFESDEECAEFWDTHDFTDYEHEFKRIDGIVFERPRKQTVTIRIEPARLKRIKEISNDMGIGHTTLCRMWILSKLKTLSLSKA